MSIAITASLLSSYYAAKYGGGTGAGASSSSTGASTTPTTPWAKTTTAPDADARVKSVLAGGKYFDSSAKTLGLSTSTTGSNTAATPDEKTLFTLYQGLSALQGVAAQAQASGASSFQQAQLEQSFASGLQQLQSFLTSNPLKNATVVQGNVSATAQSKAGVKAETDSYSGQTVYTGPFDGAVPAFSGDVKFSLSLTSSVTHSTKTVDFDLSEMGSTPRTMSNVVMYLNSKLQSAGALTRFADVRTPAQPQTITTSSGGTITLPASSDDSYSLQLNGDATEQASFSAPDAEPAVYLAGTSGTGTDAVQQLVKLDAGQNAQGSGRVFNQNLPSYVTAVRSTATAADGSVYVLADIDATTADGQTVKGSSDVALMRYDSTGALSFTRTLGSASQANGYALAVSADGSKVAVTGAVTGNLDAADPASDPTQADTFVSVYDAQGVEQWTQRAGAAADDTPAAVTFGADNSVYVTGKTLSAMPGATAQGGEDAYLLGFSASGAPTLTTQFGTSGSDKGVGVVSTASGVTVASVENGHAVLRRFDLPASGAPAASAVRDLGELQGGDLAGLTQAADGSLVLAGSTHNGALAAGASTTQAYGGGREVFVAKLDPSLAPSSSDTLSYWDAGGDASTSAVTVSGGQVYVAGQVSGAPLPGSTDDTQTGFAVAIDPSTGQPTWSAAVQGADAQDAPTAIAVAAQGASSLDRLGLPSGAISYVSTSDLIANTSLRPGDQFGIKVGGVTQTVTIDQGETLSTLAQKINRASGFQASASVVTSNGSQQLKIAPVNARSTVQLVSGPDGRDALGPLGLYEGALTSAANGSSTPVATGVGASKKITVAKPYALNIPTDLSVADATDAKRASTLLSAAMSTVQKIFSNLTTDPTATTATTSGTVPAYLSAQIANYQDALARLTGSSSSTTSTASLLTG